ncbi:MAG: tRNA adenosine(34) deaminase TadA [Alcaligenaceae bacterium]|nr:tRNA adenosine(34) deaminase TadA [Alcaligenaceae bacterium]
MLKEWGEPVSLASGHEVFMKMALQQAQLAYDCAEVPVGAIVVNREGEVVGKGYNRTITDSDPTAHAEIVALRQAAAHERNYRLPDLTVYVTLEPCVMCIGALTHARIAHIVYGASDPKTGACGSVLCIQANKKINHHTKISSGVLGQECADILRQFFRERRKGSGS